jgi:isopenicillin N synthase-like dioxygenase
VAGEAAAGARRDGRVGCRDSGGGSHPVKALGRRVGQPLRAFGAAFVDAPATLIKIVSYPAHAATSQGGGAHRGAGVLTLLLAEPGSRGLQVRRPRCRDDEDGWIDAPAVDGAFIGNIGELLEVATGGYLPAIRASSASG